MHFDLAQKILAQGGALISEFPTLTEPKPHHFPQRNRIISGLSSAVVIMEAAERSGALITAHFAIKENREVFALPGNVDLASYQGCNRLIKQGARLLSTAEDILESFALQKFLPDILKNTTNNTCLSKNFKIKGGNNCRCITLVLKMLSKKNCILIWLPNKTSCSKLQYKDYRLVIRYYPKGFGVFLRLRSFIG